MKGTATPESAAYTPEVFRIMQTEPAIVNSKILRILIWISPCGNFSQLLMELQNSWLLFISLSNLFLKKPRIRYLKKEVPVCIMVSSYRNLS